MTDKFRIFLIISAALDPFVNKLQKGPEQKIFTKNIKRWKNKCLNAALQVMRSRVRTATRFHRFQEADFHDPRL